MRKLRVFLVVLSSLLFMCSNVIGNDTSDQLAKDAIKALKKLKAKTEVGVSYRDYSSALGDVNYEVNTFLESPEAKAKPELTESVLTSLLNFTLARRIWGFKFSFPASYGIFPISEKGVDSENFPEQFGGLIIKIYPKAKKLIQNTGQGDIIVVDEVVRLIWSDAYGELNKAVNLMK